MLKWFINNRIYSNMPPHRSTPPLQWWHSPDLPQSQCSQVRQSSRQTQRRNVQVEEALQSMHTEGSVVQLRLCQLHWEQMQLHPTRRYAHPILS